VEPVRAIGEGGRTGRQAKLERAEHWRNVIGRKPSRVSAVWRVQPRRRAHAAPLPRAPQSPLQQTAAVCSLIVGME
jgi:hypothetical protein